MSSSRYPDQWIVPGGGMEPEEEPGGAAVREVYEEVRAVFFYTEGFYTRGFWLLTGGRSVVIWYSVYKSCYS